MILASKSRPLFLTLDTIRGREAVLLVLTFIFVAVNAVALSLAAEGRILSAHLWAPLVWAATTVAAHLLLSHRVPERDPFLLPIVALLTGWGLVLIDRLAPAFLARQLLWYVLGTGGLLLCATGPRVLSTLRRFRYTWLILGMTLLLATFLLGVNPSGQGPALWLKIPLLGEVYLQPSELLKLLLVVFLASYFDERLRLARLEGSHESASPLAYLAPLFLMWGFSMVVLVWQRDLGAAMLFFVVFVALLYLATGKPVYVAAGAAMLLVAGVVGYFAFEVVAARIDTWIYPWSEASGRGFQIVQSLYALASGGLLGQGVGQGYPTFVPVVHSDFAFAAIGEEWGVVGTLTVISSFLLLSQRGFEAALRARRAFGFYLAAGIVVMLGVQAFLIVAGVVRLVPLTGVTLPLVSYGGSSLLTTNLMMGLLIRISAQT
jgi:cell division protein FtsW (lipid II flippase)